MGIKQSDPSFLSSLRNKIVVAFLLAVGALLLAASTTYLGFDNLLTEVDELSAPNEKLIRLNRLFKQITKLDQHQRADAIRKPNKPHGAFLKESKVIDDHLDSLLHLAWSNDRQPLRIQTMKDILQQRDRYLEQYLKLRSTLYNNKLKRGQIDSLTTLLNTTLPPSDSSITTTEKRTTTITFQVEPEKKKNFFTRLFNGKKKEGEIPISEVKEELTVKIDTLSVYRSDSTLQEVGKMIKMMEESQQFNNKQLSRRELELINTNILLINELLSILQEVESEEILAALQINHEASRLVRHSSRNIGIIVTVFFLLAAVLVFLMLIDISNSNYYRLKLIESQKEAVHLSQVKQRFLANMSHEIRTPLQSIIGFSEQLQSDDANDGSVRSIYLASCHLLQVVNEILDYSRIESGNFTVERKPFDLKAVLKEVADSTYILAKEKGLVFECISELPEGVVEGDAFRLKQILFNLLSNAIKFTSNGNVTLRAKARVEQMIIGEFTVSDTGIGMAHEELNRVFDEFEQANKGIHEKFGGSGLGLTLVKKITTLLHGKMSATSEPGKGSVFTIEIPFEKAHQPLSVVGSVEPIVLQQSDKHVAIVDDDRMLLNLYSIILKKHQIKYTIFNESQKAMQFDFTEIAIAFIDVRMPELDGRELAREIRKKYPHVMLVAATAHVLPEERIQLLATHFDRVLLKPFLEMDFLQIIQGLPTSIRNQSSQRELTDLHKMLGEDELLVRSILADFRLESAQDIRAARSALQTNDALLLRELVHRLAARTGQLGALGLANAFQLLEQKIVGNITISAIRDEVEVAMTELEKWMIKLEEETVM